MIATNTYNAAPANCSVGARLAQWQLSAGGASSWVPLAPYTFDASEVGFGDFDGDGRTDVFSIANRQWRYSSAGRAAWRALASAGCPLSGLHVADDFTGDGSSDVFDGRCGS